MSAPAPRGPLFEALRQGDPAQQAEALLHYQPWLRLLARLQLGRRFQGKFDKGFALTQEGQRVTKEYLDRVLQEFETGGQREGAVDGS